MKKQTVGYMPFSARRTMTQSDESPEDEFDDDKKKK